MRRFACSTFKEIWYSKFQTIVARKNDSGKWNGLEHFIRDSPNAVFTLRLLNALIMLMDRNFLKLSVQED